MKLIPSGIPDKALSEENSCSPLDDFLHEDSNPMVVFGRKKLDRMVDDVWAGRCKEIDIKGLSNTEIVVKINELFEKNGLGPVFIFLNGAWDSVTKTYIVFPHD